MTLEEAFAIVSEYGATKILFNYDGRYFHATAMAEVNGGVIELGYGVDTKEENALKRMIEYVKMMAAKGAVI